MDNLHIPPHSSEAEDSVIGSILLDNSLIDQITAIIKPGDFYQQYHKDIFKAIEHCVQNNMPADMITVSDLLEQKSIGEHLANIGNMVKNVPSTSNAISYAKIIKERSILRALIGAANDISEMAYHNEGEQVINVVTRSEKKIADITDMFSNERKGTHISDALSKTIDTMESRLKNKDSLIGIPTGLSDLDDYTNGLQPGFYLLGARPSMGKTTLMLNMIVSACRAGKLCVLFSIEMPSEQITMKILADMADVSIEKIQRPINLSDLEWHRISTAMEEMKRFKLEIIDDSKATPSSIRLDLMRIKREHGDIGLVCIDYLQLMKCDNKENRTQEISEISREVNAFKKDFNCPVIALSQLNRALENRSDKRPVNSDLRESGQLEQDADVIMFLYRDEVYYEDSQDKGMAEILIRKNRLGRVGKVGALFKGDKQRFEDIGNMQLRSEECAAKTKFNFD